MSRKTLRTIAIEVLIKRAQAGDEDALAELFRRSQPMLRKLRSERLAQARPGGAGPSDVAQETAKRAFEGLPDFKGTTEGEWSAYLRKIFVHCLAELHRSAGRQKRKQKIGATLSLSSGPAMAVEAENVPALGKSPSQSASHNEEHRRLLASLHRLSPEEGEAIWLHHLRELPVSEVARVMGKNRPAILRILCRGLAALQSVMSENAPVHSGGAPAETGLSEEVITALSSYFSRRDAGEQVDKESFVAEHPGCADELRSLLEWIERIEAIWGRSPRSR